MASITPRDQLAHAEMFLRELARGIPAEERVMVGYAGEATVQKDENGKKINGVWWPQPWLDGKHVPVEKNCYVCISSSVKTPNPKTGEMRYWRSEQNFGHGLALMVDDIGNGAGSKGKLTLRNIIDVLPPTAIVETSPGNHQVYYFLDAPEKDMRKFKALLTSFVAAVLKDGGDSTIRDVTRFGRMPAGVNNKRGKDGAHKYPQDFRVGLKYFKPSVRYSCDEIARAFGFPIIVPVARVKETADKQDFICDSVWLDVAIEVCNAAMMGEGGGGVVSQNMSGKYRIRCPWGHLHTNGDESGAYFRGPIPGAEFDFVFGCGHDTCRRENRRTWATFVDEIVMPKIYADLEEINRAWFKFGVKG